MNNKVTNPIITLITLVLSLVALQTTLFSQSVVQRKLYLSSGGVLDRIDPFASGDLTLDSSAILVKSSVVNVGKTSIPQENGSSGSNAGTNSFSYTISSGDNRLLVVAISSKATGAVVTSVKFGTQDLTKHEESSSSDARIQLWYLVNPTVTTANITYNWSGLLEGTVGAADFRNVNTTSGVPFSATLTSVKTNVNSNSLSVFTLPGDLVFDVSTHSGANSFSSPTTSSSPQTLLFQGGTNDSRLGSSIQSAAAGSTTTMAWSWPSASDFASIATTLDGSSNLASFTLSPALCSNLSIPTGQTVSASVRFRVTSGTMPSGTVRSNAVISSGGTTIFNGTTATVTFTTGSGGVGSTGTLTWTGTTTAAHNLIIGQTIRLDVSNENSAVQYRLLYDSQNAPSFISIPTSASTSIQVTSFDVYDAAYNGGSITLIEPLSTTVYPRATVSTQFGYEDITGLDFKLNSTLTVPGVQVAASGCTKTYEYAWTPTVGGDNNMVATAREGLEGTVTDIDSSFVAICPLTVTGTITTSPSCTTPTGGVVEISTLNAVGPYSYNWVNTTNSTLGSGTLSPSTLSGLAAGTYLITVSNSNMCSGTTSFTLTQTIPFSYTSSVSQILCNNAANGAIDISVTSGSPTFTWSDGATTLDRSGLSPGTYSITLTQSGCSATESFTISQPANPLLVPRTSTDPTCALNDGSIDLSPSGGTTPYTYLWSNGLLAPDLYNQVAGTYTVTVTDANGCTSSTATTLTLPTCQSAPVAVDDLFQFTNDMTSTGSVRTNDTDSDTPLANLVYTLVTSPSSSQGTLTMETDGDITFVPAAGFVGIFTVQYKVCDDQSLCAFGDLTLDIAPPLYTPVCATDFSDAYSVTPDPMVDTYEWSIPEGIGAVFVSGQNTPSIIVNWTGVTETAYGNICVKTLNVCGESSTICFPVKVKRVEPAANNAEGCLGDDVSLYATAVDGSSYSWSGPNGFASNLQSPTIYNVT